MCGKNASRLERFHFATRIGVRRFRFRWAVNTSGKSWFHAPAYNIAMILDQVPLVFAGFELFQWNDTAFYRLCWLNTFKKGKGHDWNIRQD